MIIKDFDRFNESYLAGGKPPLYHSTSLHYATNILIEDCLNGKDTSFTRNKDFVYDDAPVTFIVDWDKLRNNKTSAFDYYNKTLARKDGKTNDFEAEEMVKGPVKNLHRFLMCVRLNDRIEFFQGIKHDTKEQHREIYDDFVEALKDYVSKWSTKVYRRSKEIDPTAL